MKLLVVLLAGAVLGAIVHALLVQAAPLPTPTDVTRAPLSTESASPGASEHALQPASGPSTERVAESQSAPTPERREAQPILFTGDLLAHHHAEYLRGWSETCQKPVQPSATLVAGAEAQFREGVLALSAMLGERDAAAANEADALAVSLETLDALALLEFARSGEWRPDEEFVGSERFGELLQPRTAGAALSGEAFAENRGATLEAGAVLRFGPGIHVLDERRLQAEGGAIPPDITLVGAGKDATLLRIGDISTRAFLERLTLLDMTLDAGNDGLFDVRSEGAVIDLQRVRIVRFDAGHGGCDVLSSYQGAVIRARDVDFIGGYGKSPGNGNLLYGKPIVASFESCRFERIEMRDLEPGQGSFVRFADCRFVLTEATPIHQAPGLHFEGCQYEPLPDEPFATKPLSDLFPGAQ